MFRHEFTVFTATYNRAHTLHRVHDSLAAQTYRDFEWLIVDDGSTDGTRKRVEAWQRSAGFPIRYVRQENRGKHVATNAGVRLAEGRFFLGLDSDDGCVPHALERFKHHWEAIPAAARARFTGVCALCLDERGRLVGSRFPRDVVDSDSVEIRYRHKVTGEKWGFQSTEVLRRFPFPEPRDVRFVTEAFVYRAIAREYRIRYVNEPLRVYYVHDSDQASRLVNSAPRHAASMRMYLREVLENDLKWFRYAPLQFMRYAANYGRYGFDCGVGLRAQAAQLGNTRARALWLAALPVASLYYLRDKRMQANAR